MTHLKNIVKHLKILKKKMMKSSNKNNKKKINKWIN